MDGATVRTKLRLQDENRSYNEKRKFHAGVDYRAPRGTPIPAQTPGEVVYSGYNEGYGNTVIVKTTNGYGLYAHMDEPSQARMGDRIWPADLRLAVSSVWIV
jgi:murein DD-endopeptidase MepM/ murein hydrolase activator NlpD